MSIHHHDGQTALGISLGSTVANNQNPRPNSSDTNPNVLGEDNSEDWLQQQLRKLVPEEPTLNAFLADYAQCKDCRLEELLHKMVACSSFKPPSSFQYWAPRKISVSSQELGPTFSEALDQLRVFLQSGGPGCARFWLDVPVAIVSSMLKTDV